MINYLLNVRFCFVKSIVLYIGDASENTKEGKQKDDNGESITETKIIKMSLPYLNILCSDNGKLIIKELGGE